MGPSDQRALAEELFEFAKAGDLNNMNRLISQGADIRYQTNNSLCHVAARHNQVGIYYSVDQHQLLWVIMFKVKFRHKF